VSHGKTVELISAKRYKQRKKSFLTLTLGKLERSANSPFRKLPLHQQEDAHNLSIAWLTKRLFGKTASRRNVAALRI
jgi:hypothetical protein